MTTSMIKALLEIVSAYGGYLGVFAISFASNSIPFLGVPYLLAVASYAAREGIRLGLPAYVALILASAAGSTLGKFVVYSVAASFRVRMSESTKDNLKYFANHTKRIAFPLIVLFAATPMPDDILYVPLGIARYPLAYYFLGVFVGKTIMVWLASTYFTILIGYLGEELTANPLAALGVGALTLYLTFTIMKMNWKRIAEVYSKEGVISSLKEALVEFLGACAKPFRRTLSAVLSLRRSRNGPGPSEAEEPSG